jgi:hypothetical protein
MTSNLSFGSGVSGLCNNTSLRNSRGPGRSARALCHRPVCKRLASRTPFCNASIIQVSIGDSGSFVPTSPLNECGVALALLKSSRQRKSPMETSSGIGQDVGTRYAYARPWDVRCSLIEPLRQLGLCPLRL